MAIWYTDTALAQIQGRNFPGQPGQAQFQNPPYQQNNALMEGPPTLTAIYTVSAGATEAVGDTIYVGIAPAGVVVSPNGRISTGLTAPAATLTVAVGDLDQGYLANQPIPNIAGALSQVSQPDTNIQAPVWVSGTTYAPGNVVLDAAASSGVFAQYDAYVCVAATSGTTAPHSAATTVWYPCYSRYSTSISVAAASANVSFASAIAQYGGPASIQPYSLIPGQAALGLTANQIANYPYQIQNDTWVTARILTVGTLVAGSLLAFRIGMTAAN